MKLPAELTHAQASACLQTLVDSLRADQQAGVVDASHLVQFDSSALAVLLALRRECAALGRRFVVQGLPARLQELASLYGVAQLFPAT